MNIHLNNNFFLRPMIQFKTAAPGQTSARQPASGNKNAPAYVVKLSKQSVIGNKLNANINEVAKGLRAYFDNMDEIKQRAKLPGVEYGFGDLFKKITDLSPYENTSGKFYGGTSLYDGTDAYDRMFTDTDDDLLRKAATQLARDYARDNTEHGPMVPTDETGRFMIQKLDFSYDMPDDVMQAAPGFAELSKTSFSTKEISAAIVRMTDPYAREAGTMSLSFANVTSPLFFDQKIENASALYAFYQDQAARNLTGEELDAARENIDASFTAALDRIADSIIGSGEFTGADEAGIRESVHTLFQEKAAGYSSVLSSDTFDLGVAGTENAWAAESADFVTAKLIQHTRGMDGDVQSPESNAKYSAMDLKAMIVAQDYKDEGTMHTASNEEKLGLDFGLKALYMERLLQDDSVSDAARETMRASFNASMQNALDKTDEYLLNMSGQAGDSQYLNDPLNRDVIQETFDKMLKTLQADDFQSALRDTIRDIEKQYQLKQLAQYESGSVQERNAVSLMGTTLLNEVDLYNFASKLNSAMKHMYGEDEVLNIVDFINTNRNLWDMPDSSQKTDSAAESDSLAAHSASATKESEYNPTSEGNFWYMGQRANVEGAYHSAIDPTAYVPIGYMIRPDDYDHDFLYIGNEFITEYATKLANGRDDEDLNNRVWYYSERALEYFGGYNNEYKDGTLVNTGESITARVYLHHSEEQIRPVYDQLAGAINEYAQLIKNGETDITKVKSKINIGDMEFSLSELVKTHDFLSKVVQNANHNNFDARYYASAGLSIAAVNHFADNELSPDTAKKVSAMFEKRVDDTIVSRNDRSRPARKAVWDAVFAQSENGEREKAMLPPNYDFSMKWGTADEATRYFSTLNGDMSANTFNAKAYSKFKDIQGTDLRSFDLAFKEAMQWMEGQLKAWYDHMGHTAAVKKERVGFMMNQLQTIYSNSL